MKIILGSKSPRRKEILSQAGYHFEVVNLSVDEAVDNYKDSIDYVKQVVSKKASAFNDDYYDDLVICADTIVEVGNSILGKPHSTEEAFKMIDLIQGTYHYVHTGVCLKYKGKVKEFVVTTKVYIVSMSEEEILTYINTDEPYDKAGGYAIQGIFSKYILKIMGDYYNVMGLPICRLNKEIKKFI